MWDEKGRPQPSSVPLRLVKGSQCYLLLPT
jgi:hypothetical protein